MSKTNVKSEIDSKLWDKLKNKFRDLEDHEILDKLINEYSKYIIDNKAEENLLADLGDQKKLTESLRKKCKNFALRVKDLEDTQADRDTTIQKLNKQIKKLSKDFPDFDEKGKVKEKIVYREDTKTIKELKEKLDKGIITNRKYRQERKNLRNELREKKNLFS